VEVCCQELRKFTATASFCFVDEAVVPLVSQITESMYVFLTLNQCAKTVWRDAGFGSKLD